MYSEFSWRQCTTVVKQILTPVYTCVLYIFKRNKFLLVPCVAMLRNKVVKMATRAGVAAARIAVMLSLAVAIVRSMDVWEIEKYR